MMGWYSHEMLFLNKIDDLHLGWVRQILSTKPGHVSTCQEYIPKHFKTMPMQVFLYSNMMNSKNSGIAIPFLQVFEKRCHTIGV